MTQMSQFVARSHDFFRFFICIGFLCDMTKKKEKEKEKKKKKGFSVTFRNYVFYANY